MGANKSEHKSFIKSNIVYSVDTGDKSINETLGQGNMSRIVVGTFKEHLVLITDGRHLRHQMSNEITGFELLDHETKVSDFYDIDKVKSIYYEEVNSLIMQVTNAKKVVIFDHTLRSGDEASRNTKKIREPVLSAHNDYTEWSGPQRVREIMPMQESDKLLKKRFSIIQVWRPINGPIKSNPLAICDARSVEQKDFIKTERRYPNRTGETYRLLYNPNHKWYYFPNMKQDEVIVFKVYDSSRDGRARFTPHTSFEDPNTPPDSPPRESIEVRALVFY
jgi:hypothetical protein